MELTPPQVTLEGRLLDLAWFLRRGVWYVGVPLDEAAAPPYPEGLERRLLFLENNAVIKTESLLRQALDRTAYQMAEIQGAFVGIAAEGTYWLFLLTTSQRLVESWVRRHEDHCANCALAWSTHPNQKCLFESTNWAVKDTHATASLQALEAWSRTTREVAASVFPREYKRQVKELAQQYWESISPT